MQPSKGPHTFCNILKGCHSKQLWPFQTFITCNSQLWGYSSEPAAHQVPKVLSHNLGLQPEIAQTCWDILNMIKQVFLLAVQNQNCCNLRCLRVCSSILPLAPPPESKNFLDSLFTQTASPGPLPHLSPHPRPSSSPGLYLDP